MLQVTKRQALGGTGKGDAGFQLLGVLGADLDAVLDVQGLDPLHLLIGSRLGGGSLGLLHTLQAGDVLVDGGDLGFKGVEGLGLFGVQGHTIFGGLGHDGFHFGSLGDAGLFELRDLFSDGFHVVALLGLRRLDGLGTGCRSAGRGNANDRDSLAAQRGQLFSVEGLDAADGRVHVARDGDQGKLEDFGLEEADTAVIHPGILDGPEADGDATDQSSLQRLPGLVDALLEPALFLHIRKLGGESDALGSRLVELDRADRLVVIVLPEQREGVLELDAQRLDDVANTVRGRSGGDAGDDALTIIQRLHLEDAIGSIHFGLSRNEKTRTERVLGHRAISPGRTSGTSLSRLAGSAPSA
ncbi:hypothetical protein FQZ97_744150 [compost metagenome]